MALAMAARRISSALLIQIDFSDGYSSAIISHHAAVTGLDFASGIEALLLMFRTSVLDRDSAECLSRRSGTVSLLLVPALY